VAAAEETPRSVVAINDRGLLLVQDSFGAWLIRGSADGLVYAAEDRLVWLLPLLEHTAADVSAALPQVSLTDTPLPALVRFALTTGAEYWPALALGWLESGWPIGDLLDALPNPASTQACAARAATGPGTPLPEPGPRLTMRVVVRAAGAGAGSGYPRRGAGPTTAPEPRPRPPPPRRPRARS
jgi:hypothetical protein